VDHDSDAQEAREAPKSGYAQRLGTIPLTGFELPLVITTPNSPIWDLWPGNVYEVNELDKGKPQWRAVERLLEATGKFLEDPYPF